MLPGLHAPLRLARLSVRLRLGPPRFPLPFPAEHGSLEVLAMPCCFWLSATGKMDTSCSNTQEFFCAASTVFLMEVAVSLHITLSAFLPWFQLQKSVFLFRGIFPLVLHNFHTLKHLYARVCSVNYILKLLNAQPFSSTNLVLCSCLASVLWTGLTVFMLFYLC